jgi:hypothetical protein
MGDLGFPKTFSSELLVPPISSLASCDKVLSAVALFPSGEATGYQHDRQTQGVSEITDWYQGPLECHRDGATGTNQYH